MLCKYLLVRNLFLQLLLQRSQTWGAIIMWNWCLNKDRNLHYSLLFFPPWNLHFYGEQMWDFQVMMRLKETILDLFYTEMKNKNQPNNKAIANLIRSLDLLFSWAHYFRFYYILSTLISTFKVPLILWNHGVCSVIH